MTYASHKQQKENQAADREIGTKSNAMLGLLCAAQAVIFGMNVDRQFGGAMLAMAGAFMGGMIMLGSSYIKPTNVNVPENEHK